jgi:hypothetical protein
MKYLSIQQMLFVLSFFVLFIIISCDKEDDFIDNKKFYYYYLTSEQIAQSPYFIKNKYDTLSFFNTKGDTFTFRKTNTDSSFIVESSNYVNGLTDVYMYQYLHNTYQTLKGDGRLEIWHKTKSVTNSIVINIGSKEFSYESDRVGRDLNNWPFYSYYKIGNQLFKNVTMFNPLLDNSAYIYVNVDDGLITFINNQTNDTLQLIKK